MGGRLKWVWTTAVAVGVVGAVVGYVVPRLLEEGEDAVRGAVGSNAPLVATVRHPGEYQSESFFTPMYLVGGISPKGVPVDVLEAGQSAFYDWARRNGGVPGQEQPFRLTLRGRTGEPVIIDAIRPVLVDRRDPLEGWFTHDRGCGGVEVRNARIDLDAESPTIVFTTPGSDAEAEPEEQLSLTLQVTATDVEVIDVLAVTRRSDVRWRLEVLYSAANENGVLVVGDGARPFEVTALAAGRAQFYRRAFPAAKLVREHSGDPAVGGVSFC